MAPTPQPKPLPKTMAEIEAWLLRGRHLERAMDLILARENAKPAEAPAAPPKP
jgi:hypothetical protein